MTTHWRDEALCTQSDPALWDTDTPDLNAAGKRICNTCPVQTECLTEAKRMGVVSGIWAGIDHRPKYLPDAYATEKELDRRSKARTTALAKRAEFAAAAETAITQGIRIADFAKSRGIKPASVRSYLRTANRPDLVDTWIKAELHARGQSAREAATQKAAKDKARHNAEAQTAYDQIPHDPEPVVAYRRHQLETNS